jgi:hypothetical protein
MRVKAGRAVSGSSGHCMPCFQVGPCATYEACGFSTGSCRREESANARGHLLPVGYACAECMLCMRCPRMGASECTPCRLWVLRVGPHTTEQHLTMHAWCGWLLWWCTTAMNGCKPSQNKVLWPGYSGSRVLVSHNRVCWCQEYSLESTPYEWLAGRCTCLPPGVPWCVLLAGRMYPKVCVQTVRGQSASQQLLEWRATAMAASVMHECWVLPVGHSTASNVAQDGQPALQIIGTIWQGG